MPDETVRVIEYLDGVVYYALQGRAFRLKVTEAMCSLSLGEEHEEIQDTFGYGMQPEQYVEKTWVHPESGNLTIEQAGVIAQEHHLLAVPLSGDELEEYGREQPEYLFYLNK